MPDKSEEPGRALSEKTPITRIDVKRPLVPVVLSLMLGFVAAAWGIKITGIWLVVGLAGLLAVLYLIYCFGSVRGSKDKHHDDYATQSDRRSEDNP